MQNEKPERGLAAALAEAAELDSALILNPPTAAHRFGTIEELQPVEHKITMQQIDTLDTMLHKVRSELEAAQMRLCDIQDFISKILGEGK